MHWRDTAILLQSIRNDDDTCHIQVMSEHHGRAQGLLANPGLVPGPGAEMVVIWSKNAETQGSFTIESTLCTLMPPENEDEENPVQLLFDGLSAMLGNVIRWREPDPGIYHALQELVYFVSLEPNNWAGAYARWELRLIRELGFASDMTRLHLEIRAGESLFLVPRTGRILTRAEVGPWMDRVLPIPFFLFGRGSVNHQDLATAFDVTALLFEQLVFPATSKRHLPDARSKLVTYLLNTIKIQKKTKTLRRLLSNMDRTQDIAPLMVPSRFG